MDYQEYVRLTSQISQSVDSNKLKEAEDALYPLLLSDISDIDKAAVCVKLAKIYDRMGKTEQALAWFDKGIVYEQTVYRYQVIEEKAHYLTQLGHCGDAVAIYETLLKQPFLTEAEKERVRKEMKVVLSRSIGQWK